MKGIILAGGKGSRLYPITKGVSKQLIPLYNKPMVYYPLTTLMLADIREILIITNREYIESYKCLLGSGEDFGCLFEYIIQEDPGGLPEAFKYGENFIQEDSVALALGDNLFFGNNFASTLRRIKSNLNGATVLGVQVSNPSEYGVVEFDNKGQIKDLIEKPTNPPSDFIIPGLYFFDNSVVKRTKQLEPSKRGELEITDLLRTYLEENILYIEKLPRGFSWFDTGTHDSLLDASNFVRQIEKNTNSFIGSPEEIAFRKGWIDKIRLQKLSNSLKNKYGEYLNKLI